MTLKQNLYLIIVNLSKLNQKRLNIGLLAILPHNFYHYIR